MTEPDPSAPDSPLDGYASAGSSESPVQLPPLSGGSPPPEPRSLRMELGRLPTVRTIGAILGIAVSGAILGLIPELHIVIKAVLLGLLALSATRVWKTWRYPTVLELSSGRFRWRILGAWASTPAANISRMDLRGGLVRLQFFDPAAVEGASPNAAMMKAAAAGGFHVAIPGGSVTVPQIREIQGGLDLPLQESDEQGEELAAFVNQMRRGTPRLWVTPAIIAINAIVFLLMLRADPSAGRIGGSFFTNGFSTELTLNWGANYGPRTSGGEPWRLFTCMFLHFNILHIGLNMWALWVVGRGVERILGNSAYLTTYLFAGFCGSLASHWWHYDAMGVGASGAVFGIMGAMLGIVLRQRNTFPAETVRSLRSQSVSLLVINLLLGAQIKGIDMAAHVGGAVGGLLCGLAIDSKILANGARRSAWQLPRLVVGCLGLCVIVIAALPGRRVVIAEELQEVFQLEARLMRQLEKSESELRAGRIAPEAFEATVRKKVLSPWDAERARIEALDRVAAADKSARDDLAEFMRLRKKSWTFLTRGGVDDSAAEQGRGLLKMDEAFETLRRLSDRDGERLGIRLTIPEPPRHPEGAIARLAAVESDVSRQLNQLLDRHDNRTISDQQLADAIETSLVPPLEREESRGREVVDEARGTIQSRLRQSLRNTLAEIEALRRLARSWREGKVPAPEEAIERLRRLESRPERETARNRARERERLSESAIRTRSSTMSCLTVRRRGAAVT